MNLIKGYPESMRESIEKVEKTREKRLKEKYQQMSLDERDEVLNKYHPDYKPEVKRKLSIGSSKGEIVPMEVADLIESYPLVSEKDIDLTSIDYDVDLLIIGGGGAGTMAGIWATYEGIDPQNILMTTKLRHGDSNSIMAQGGIQAADKANDSPEIHYLDVIGGGHFANEPELVEALVSDGPAIIKWFESKGVMFDKQKDGTMITIHGGGTSRKRMHSAKDYTGMELLRVIRDEFINLSIPVIEFSPAIELLMDDKGQIAGAVLFNIETHQYYVVRAKATVMGTGGFGRLHIQGFPTTNHYGATADGLVMAYRCGARLRDMDSVQYHPTGAAFPEQIVGLLITEKVRGLGAQPLNRDGNMFVHPLEPRDVESAAFIKECYGAGLGVETPTGMQGVWLDSPMINMLKGEGTTERELSAMYRMFKRFDINMVEDPILVFPTLHYQNGGVVIDANGATELKGLFAGGEVTGGVHGKNRLMGNSLLDYSVFGRRAGISAAKYAKKASIGELTLSHVTRYRKELEKAGVPENRKSPMILPEYRGRNVLSRAIDIF